MQRSNRLGWFPTNLLLLAGTVFVGVFVFFLYEAEEAKSTSVIVMDALFGTSIDTVVICTSKAWRTSAADLPQASSTKC